MSQQLLQHYELLLLAKTEITDDEQSMVKREIEQLINARSGTLDQLDRWGKYRLSYPVEKNDYGVYILIRYSLQKGKESSELNKAIAMLLKIKCNDIVMRFSIVRLDKRPSLQYEKPDALDAAGKVANVDSLMKENNMDSLLSSVDASIEGVVDAQFDNTDNVEA